jgi:hypothetical protein
MDPLWTSSLIALPEILKYEHASEAPETVTLAPQYRTC